jgi:hypothetical protein
LSAITNIQRNPKTSCAFFSPYKQSRLIIANHPFEKERFTTRKTTENSPHQQTPAGFTVDLGPDYWENEKSYEKQILLARKRREYPFNPVVWVLGKLMFV